MADIDELRQLMGARVDALSGLRLLLALAPPEEFRGLNKALERLASLMLDWPVAFEAASKRLDVTDPIGCLGALQEVVAAVAADHRWKVVPKPPRGQRHPMARYCLDIASAYALAFSDQASPSAQEEFRLLVASVLGSAMSLTAIHASEDIAAGRRPGKHEATSRIRSAGVAIRALSEQNAIPLLQRLCEGGTPNSVAERVANHRLWDRGDIPKSLARRPYAIHKLLRAAAGERVGQGHGGGGGRGPMIGGYSLLGSCAVEEVIDDDGEPCGKLFHPVCTDDDPAEFGDEPPVAAR